MLRWEITQLFDLTSGMETCLESGPVPIFSSNSSGRRERVYFRILNHHQAFPLNEGERKRPGRQLYDGLALESIDAAKIAFISPWPP